MVFIWELFVYWSCSIVIAVCMCMGFVVGDVFGLPLLYLSLNLELISGVQCFLLSVVLVELFFDL